MLAQSPPIPSPDAFGLPAHAALFIFLYHLTFVLHFVFMNFSLGGTAIALVNDVRCALGSKKRDYLLDLNRRIFAMMPITISFAITFGVAPLLFVQVLYGQFFYPAKILVGLPMMGVVGILIVVFYLAYVVGIRREGASVGRSVGRVAISLGMLLGFLAVAWLWTLNTVWSMNPQLWAERYHSGGWLPLVADMHIYPRYLHNIIGATAIACILVALMARVLRYRMVVNDEWAERTVRGSLLGALILTGLQAIVGIGLVLHVIPEARHDLLHPAGSWSGWFWKVGVVLVIPLVMCLVMGVRRPRRPLWAWGSLALVLGVLVGMSLARQSLRDSYLRVHGKFDVFAAWSGNTNWQWGAIAMFAITLVAGLALTAWLLWWVWNMRVQKSVVATGQPSTSTVPPTATPQELTPAGDADQGDGEGEEPTP